MTEFPRTAKAKPVAAGSNQTPARDSPAAAESGLAPVAAAASPAVQLAEA